MMYLPEGLVAYLHWKNGYPPLYRCMAEMPAEAGLVLEYCLNREWRQDCMRDLATVHTQAEALWRQMGVLR